MTEEAVSHPLAHYQIIRRNGAVVPFEPNKIAIAMMKAFLAVHGSGGLNADGSDELAADAEVLLRADYLSQFRKGAASRAVRTGVARHLCGLRARRRRSKRHGLRPVSWHWRVHDG